MFFGVKEEELLLTSIGVDGMFFTDEKKSRQTELQRLRFERNGESLFWKAPADTGDSRSNQRSNQINQSPTGKRRREEYSQHSRDEDY